MTSDISDIADVPDMADMAEVPDVEGSQPQEPSVNAMGQDPNLVSIEVQVGDFVFDAIAAGPADGPAVILLHGFPQTSHSMRHHVERLGAAGYRAIAPDQRGYSPRARPTDIADYEMDHLVGDVIGITDALGIGPFHLVGHDWGAAVAWFTASMHPDRLLSVTPISVPHPIAFANALNDPDSGQAAASGYMNLFRQEGTEDSFAANDAALLRTVYTGLDEADIEVYADALGTPEAMAGGLAWYRANDFSVAPEIEPITTRTLLIWSDGDMFLLRPGIEASGEQVQGPFRLEIIEGVNHWVPELAADRVSELLLEHLSDG